MEELQVDEADGVATITLNRPHRKNAVTQIMWSELRVLFRELGYRDDIRAVVITGAGDAFCSGADVGGMASSEGDRVHSLQAMRNVGDTCQALFDMPKITIAKVNGVAAGAGLNMALACDLVVASDRARFSEIFAKRGLSVDFGGSFLLPRIVGMQRAKELVLLAEIIDATAAEQMGLVNRVVAHDELDAFVADWAAKAAASAPRAIAMSKALLNRSFTNTLAEAVDAEGVAQSYNFTTGDTKEAVSAFLERRDPTYTGW
ncbi:MAG: enoyl-CoA hydratase/isomerase family protein [Acidimicrobiales bacterium]